jgi:serine/threonine protein kinase
VIYPLRQQDAKAENLGYIAIVFLVLMVIVATLVISIALKRKLGRKKKGNILLLQTSASHRFFQKSPPSPVDRWTISVNSFDPDSFNLIGEGAFSSVYFCNVQGPLSTPTNLHHFKNCVEHPVAVKICKETASENELIAFKNECTIYKHLSANCCPYILQLVGLQLQSPPPMIALELVYCGSLLDLLQNSTVEIKEGSSTKCLKDQKRKISLIEFQRQCEGKVDSFVSLKERSKQELQGTNDLTISIKWSQLMKFIVQIARGMEFLISQGVLHRDVACRNFLLSNGIVKISDFGFACLLNDQECVETDLPTECKPLRWMSPEAFNMNLFSEASEVWSFGVSLWEICTKGCFPYSSLSDAEVLKAIQSEDYLKCPEGCDDKVYQIMLQCWTKDRTSRPTFTMLTRKLEECMCELYPYVVMTDDKQ